MCTKGWDRNLRIGLAKARIVSFVFLFREAVGPIGLDSDYFKRLARSAKPGTIELWPEAEVTFWNDKAKRHVPRATQDARAMCILICFRYFRFGWLVRVSSFRRHLFVYSGNIPPA